MDDLELAINYVADLYPGAAVCGVGLSTGAGQIKNYVNARGRRSRLAAAVLVDGAPFWGPAIELFDRNLPLLSRVLTTCARPTFQHILEPEIRFTRATSSIQQAATVEDPIVAKRFVSGGFAEFVHLVQAPAMGFPRNFEGTQQYFESCVPADASGCAVPVLELLNYNDTLIAAEFHNITRKDAEKSSNVIVTTTREGTHMIRWEGILPKCWLRRVSNEFLEAALQITEKVALRRG